MAVSSKITRMNDITLGTKGIEIKVHDGSSQLGDLYVKKSAIEWCEGSKHEGNGAKISYRDLNWIAHYQDEILAKVKKWKKRDGF